MQLKILILSFCVLSHWRSWETLKMLPLCKLDWSVFMICGFACRRTRKTLMRFYRRGARQASSKRRKSWKRRPLFTVSVGVRDHVTDTYGKPWGRVVVHRTMSSVINWNHCRHITSFHHWKVILSPYDRKIIAQVWWFYVASSSQPSNKVMSCELWLKRNIASYQQYYTRIQMTLSLKFKF